MFSGKKEFTETTTKAFNSTAWWSSIRRFGMAWPLNAQRKIIKDLKEVTLEALGEELGESNKATIAQQVIATPVDPKEQIAYSENGLISIPGRSLPIRRAALEKSFP